MIPYFKEYESEKRRMFSEFAHQQFYKVSESRERQEEERREKMIYFMHKWNIYRKIQSEKLEEKK